MNVEKSLLMQSRARKRIPGVTQLLSKRPEMFAPGQWPGYYSKASGAEVWDLDGNKYIDMSISGIGANVLGYCDPDVDSAVIETIHNCNSNSLNCPEEVELADLLCSIHPWASMVRYARCGGEAMAVAVRIARAYAKKSLVLFSGYHGWHDWYLSTNIQGSNRLSDHLLPGLEPNGVPAELLNTSIPFIHKNTDELEKLLIQHKGKVAAIVIEPVRNDLLVGDFLKRVRELATQNSVVLVFDEVTAAFRMNTGASHLLFNVEPDIAVFAKAISNGYPMAAIIGKEDVMQAAQTTFISSTYWTERIGPTAAIATINKHQKYNVGDHLLKIGQAIQEGWSKAAGSVSLKIHVEGIYPLSHFSFEYPNGQAMMTLFVQLMLEKGFLASNRFYASFAHTMDHVRSYLLAVERVFSCIAELQKNNSVEKELKGPVAHSGFKRLT